jgi:hypothetical protein
LANVHQTSQVCWHAKNHLHNKSAAICSTLWYDDILRVLLGSDVDLAVAFRNGNLSNAGRSEGDGGEDSVQHVDGLIFTFGLFWVLEMIPSRCKSEDG